MSPLPPLYAVADASFGDPVEIATELFSAGVRLIQVRNKNAPSGTILDQTVRIVRGAPPGVTVIVNDRADIARLSGAGGVHVGQEDLPPASARRIVGARKIVGVSTHDEAQARMAASEPVDYLAVGPVFATSTRRNPSPVVGLDRLHRICESVNLPVVAIGGIRLPNVEDVLAAGAASVAVIADLIGQGDVRQRASEFLAKLNALGNV